MKKFIVVIMVLALGVAGYIYLKNNIDKENMTNNVAIEHVYKIENEEVSKEAFDERLSQLTVEQTPYEQAPFTTGPETEGANGIEAYYAATEKSTGKQYVYEQVVVFQESTETRSFVIRERK